MAANFAIRGNKRRFRTQTTQKSLDIELLFHWYTIMRRTSPLLSSEKGYQEVLDLILSEETSFGTPLSERKLADALGMSRTPVREILRRLAGEGLLTIYPQRGSFLREPTIDDIREIYEVRLAVETMAAHLAATRPMTVGLKAVGKLLLRLNSASSKVSIARIQSAGRQLHVEILKAAQNRLLNELYEALCLRIALSMKMIRHYDPDRVKESVGEHLVIYQAIEQRDTVGAQDAISRHLRRALESRIKILDTTIIRNQRSESSFHHGNELVEREELRKESNVKGKRRAG